MGGPTLAAGSVGVRLYGPNHSVTGNVITDHATAVDESGAGPAYNLVVGNRVDSPIVVTSTGSVVGLNLGTGSLTLSDGATMTLGTVDGLKIGTAAAQKLGFYGQAPVVQPSGVAVSAAEIHAALVALGLITA